MSTTYVVTSDHRGGMHFVTAVGPYSVSMDYPRDPTGSGEGPRPLEMLLAALASCAGGTLVALLHRSGRPISGLSVQARGTRRAEHPTVFTAIELEFTIRGTIDRETVAAAIREAEERVCPVWAMLRSSTPITASLHVEPAAAADLHGRGEG